MSKLKVYVGCSLQYATQEFRDSVEKFKENLKADFEVLAFLGLKAESAQEIYEWDLSCVRSADFMIADCSQPSLGLGFELGIAHEMGKTVFVIAHKDAVVSRMILGITKPNFYFYRYENIMEVVELVKAKLAGSN